MAGARQSTDGASATYRHSSFWLDDLVLTGRDELAPRSPLAADARFDVCIVGGGLTGLWTAYSLAKADPQLRIAVLEREIAGFGASGRNGGWCSALFPRSPGSLERRHGFDAGLYCRADDRGDPVIQLAPPLTIGVPEFREIEQILRSVLTEASNRH